MTDKRPPWFDRFTRLIERSWDHHGACASLNVTSAFDTQSEEWLIVAGPVFQEVLGGEDDGKKVWTGFVFHMDDFLKADEVFVEHLAVASYCNHCNPAPKVMLAGKYRGHKFRLQVCLEPLLGTKAVEIIDTLRCKIWAMPGAETGGDP